MLTALLKERIAWPRLRLQGKTEENKVTGLFLFRQRASQDPSCAPINSGATVPSVLLSGRHLLHLHGAVFHLHEGTRIPLDKYEIAGAEGQSHRRRSWEDAARSLSTFQNVRPQRISQGHRRRKTETTAFDPLTS